MRNIPGLSGEVLARASRLATKARDARTALPGVAAPTASIAPAKVTDGVATLRLYDYIDPDGGYWGISANEFADALDSIDGEVTSIELLINSGGGSVWDGLAILNTLRSHPAPVTARVDGVAASAASFIAVACDEVVMMPNSRLMIHDAMGLCIGQSADMREYAAFLDDTSDNIAEIYATKTGGDTAEWRTTMTAKGLIGQWYSAQDALAAGLIDKIGGQEAPQDRAPSVPNDNLDTPEPVAADDADMTEQRARFERTRHAENARKATA